LGMAQVIECLPSILEALDSIASTTKKKKKKKVREKVQGKCFASSQKEYLPPCLKQLTQTKICNGFQNKAYQKMKGSRAPVAHACNPNYSGGREQEDGGLRRALGK
jgi:hypothetical protein